MTHQLKFQRLLVTGGAGFIGSHLVDVLTGMGYQVRILDNLSSGTLKNVEPLLKNGDAQLIKGDIRNTQDVKDSLKGIDAVFHLAAIVSVPYSIMYPEATNEVNAQGTRNLLDASIESGVERFLYVSTCAVYGEPKYLPVDEDHPLKPVSPYAVSKLKGERYCAEYLKKYGLKTLILRLFNVYGLRQIANEYSGVITRFIELARNGDPPIIYGDGQQSRDFVHVSDVVRALLLSMKSDKAVGVTFNIGSGRQVTINELCRLILEKLKTELEPVYKEPRPGDIKHSYANIEKAERILGYKPRIRLENGLTDIM